MADAARWKRKFGVRLKEARELRSMPVGDFVQWMRERTIRKSFNRDTLHAWESGTTEPRFSDGFLVCKLLKIRPDWLFDGEGPRDA